MNRKRTKDLFCAVFGMVVISLTGCAGMNGLPQGLGINSTSRVPPPSTGSFTVPNSYTNGSGSPSGVSSTNTSNPPTSSPTLGALQSNNSGSGTVYADQVLSSVNRIQSRIQDTSNQVRDEVARTTNTINSRVEQAGARVNRIGEGVVQAGTILSDSFEEASQIPAPISSAPSAALPATTQDPNAVWRNPTSIK